MEDKSGRKNGIDERKREWNIRRNQGALEGSDIKSRLVQNEIHCRALHRIRIKPKCSTTHSHHKITSMKDSSFINSHDGKGTHLTQTANLIRVSLKFYLKFNNHFKRICCWSTKPRVVLHKKLVSYNICTSKKGYFNSQIRKKHMVFETISIRGRCLPGIQIPIWSFHIQKGLF